MSNGLTRRGLLGLLTQPLRAPGTPRAEKPAVPTPRLNPAVVAVIQGRFCLAYTSVCTICSEHCPVPGAIQVQRGLPMVAPSVCTGCGVCHEVCPAPRNAVLVVPRKVPGHGR